jgi:hypothetical protein
MAGKERGRLLSNHYDVLVKREHEIASPLVAEIGALSSRALNHHVPTPLMRLTYYADVASRDWTSTMPFGVRDRILKLISNSWLRRATDVL